MAATAIIVTEAGGTSRGPRRPPGPAQRQRGRRRNGILHDEFLGYLNMRY